MPEPEIGNKEEKLNILRLQEIRNQQVRGDIRTNLKELQRLRVEIWYKVQSQI